MFLLQVNMQSEVKLRRKPMKILACCKIVPEEQDLSINKDRTVNLERAEPKISQYDLNALEAAAQIAEAVPDSTVTALAIGGKKYLENSKIRKNILSRGPDSLAVVVDDGLAASLSDRTADVLAGAARKLGFDIILCGEGSGDLYAQQVGLLLGEKLGVPCINAVSKIETGVASVTVERSLEDEVQVLELPLPAVLCLTSDINVPRIPSMKSILAAGKKTVTVMSLADIEAVSGATLSTMTSILAPEQVNRLNIIIEGDTDEHIASFVENLRKILN